ncbi:hypothetical protein BO71DRAFT_483672 [Aspergillus ellipticus CBS 707.79]|uniref:Integral membrane protein n=1 Tax=Aspergillus ellipticus CBS 707.79 TaxID=1448320 RepID=A0A319DBW8_9EURO|nr:hypothetical protein BO71DRAFT_483672 [Aspergillus ellipticus CBS 707.79]
MNKTLITITLVLLSNAKAVTGNSNTSTTDNVSFTAISQILPLLGLFGQDLTNDFLRQSINIPDWILFSVGPLGVGWVIVAAIRVLGSRSLKNKIGKGPEDEALIEKDLMSSTSSAVCELWDGTDVVRIIGKADIQEFMLLGSRLWRPADAKTQRLQSSNEKERDTADVEHVSKYPPNLSLNLRSRHQGPQVYLAAAITVMLQSIFIVVVVLLRFLDYFKPRFKVLSYAFVLSIVGTGLLTFGLFVCSAAIGYVTKRIVWKPRSDCEDPRLIIWVQRGKDDDSPRFSSYIIFKELKDELVQKTHPFPIRIDH